MLTSIDVKFIFDISCLSGTLGNKELFSSGNILQIEDVVRRVGFLLFLLCFYFFLVKRAKCFAILYSLSQQLSLILRSQWQWHD